MSAAADFIDYVPKDVAENLAWRIRMREAAARDRHVRRALYDAAMSDVLFFFNAFLWVHEPRAAVKTKPFVTWPHQDPVIVAMDEAITEALRTEEPLSLTVKKSRAQGATFAYLGVDIRRAIREPGFSVGLVTRNEDMVDSTRNPDTVMYKLAWMLDRLPFWMLPGGYDRHKGEHTITLPNGSLFAGYSATGDVARGGRKTKFDFDEPGSEEFIAAGKDYKVLSSVSSVSNCTFLVSTFGSDTGVFYEAATDPDNPRLYTLDWKDNPTQTRNAYIMREGVLVAVDPGDQAAVTRYGKARAAQLKRLERRGHVMEGKFRSPWYDAYCLLPGATPRFVARELDMNPRGAVGKVFDVDVLDRMKEKSCRPPVWQGKPVFDSETLELKGLIKQENGPLKLWFLPGLDNAVPYGNYGLGCDISAGGVSETASNSVASGVNLYSGEQVLEYTARGMQPTKFARVSVGLARWLRKARLNWETTGPTGSTFGIEVLEVLYYANVYMRDAPEIGSLAKTRKAGWANYRDEDKAKLFEDLCIAMEEGEYVPRSEDMVIECGEWEWANGKIVHKSSRTAGIDEKAHGDRCVGAGVANLLLSERRLTGIDKKGAEAQDEAPYGCLAWRIGREKLRKGKLDDTDDGGGFGIRELLGMGELGMGEL